MSSSTTDEMAAAVAQLCSVIADLERERERARRQLASSHGADAEALALALKQLEEKLVEARQKRDDLEKRAGRVERMVALTEELRSIRPELEAQRCGSDRPTPQSKSGPTCLRRG
ncbi:MAG: hypothetical protein KC731_33255 [Myxococcales bacterium]|nr:hypothetical protein [Myxococcales bacterium]